MPLYAIGEAMKRGKQEWGLVKEEQRTVLALIQLFHK